MTIDEQVKKHFKTWTAYAKHKGEDKTNFKRKILQNLERLNNYVSDLGLSIVIKYNEEINCPCCGSDKTYKTDAVHCNRCAVTTEI